MQVGQIVCFTSSRWPVEKLMLRRPLYCQHYVCVLKFGQHYYVGLKLFVNTCTSSLELDFALISLTIIKKSFYLRKQKTVHHLLLASFFRFSWQIVITMWCINKCYLLDITFFSVAILFGTNNCLLTTSNTKPHIPY